MADNENLGAEAEKKALELRRVLRQLQDMYEQSADLLNKIDKNAKISRNSIRRNQGMWDNIHDTVEEFSKDYKDYSNLAKQLKEFSTLRLQPKSITTLFALLKKTGKSVSEIKKELGQNISILNGDLRELYDDIDRLGDVQDELLDNIAKTINSVDVAASRFGKTSAEFNQNVTTNFTALGASLDRLKSKNYLSSMKINPSAAASNIKKIHTELFSRLGRIKAEFGFDSHTMGMALEEMQESYNKVSEYEEAIARIMGSGAEAQTKENQKALKNYTQMIAAETAAASNKVYKLEQMGKANKELIDHASQGMRGVLDLVGDVHQEFARGFMSFRGMDPRQWDIAGGLRSFARAQKKAKFAGAVGSTASKAAGGSGAMGSLVGIVGMVGKIAFFSQAMIMIIKLLIDARNQAAEMNKGLTETFGLTDLGIDFKSDGYKEIKDKFDGARKEIYGEMGQAWKYGVDSEEVMGALGALQQAGITRDRLQKEGLNLRSATDGVFTYAALFGKSYGEMGQMMGKFAYSMGMGIEDTEKKFAEINSYWKGTRVSIDDFASTLEEITMENAIYGNRTSEVTKILGLTGKNALLGGKALVDAQKNFTSVIDSMDPGRFKSVIDQLGDANYIKFLEEGAQNLNEQLARIPDKSSQEAKDLLGRINTINGIVTQAKKGTMGIQAAKRAAMQLSEQDQGILLMQSIKQFLMKQTGRDESYFKTHNAQAVLQDGQNYNLIMGTFFEGDAKRMAEMEKFLGGFTDSAGNVNKSFDQVSEFLAQNRDEVKDLTQANIEAKDAAAKAAAASMTSDKMFKIAAEQLLSKLQGTVSNIEDIVIKLLGLDKKGEAKRGVDQSIDQAGKSDPKSKLYQEYFKNALENFIALSKDARATPDEIKAAWSKFTPEMQESVAKITQGDLSPLDKLDLDTDKKAALVTESKGAVNKLPKEQLDTFNNTTAPKAAASSSGAGVGKYNLSSGVASMVDSRGRENIQAYGKVDAEELAFGQQYMQAQGVQSGGVFSPALNNGKGFSMNLADNSHKWSKDKPTNAVSAFAAGIVKKTTGNSIDILTSNRGKSFIFRYNNITPQQYQPGTKIVEGMAVGYRGTEASRTAESIQVLDANGKKLNINPGKALAQLGLLDVSKATREAADKQNAMPVNKAPVVKQNEQQLADAAAKLGNVKLGADGKPLVGKQTKETNVEIQVAAANVKTPSSALNLTEQT